LVEEPACKPDPVRGPRAAGDHLSRRALARSTRRGSPAPCGYPGARAGRPRTLPARLAPDGGCRAATVTRRAGGLLPHRFTLTAARAPRRSAFCCPFARSPPPGSRQRPALWSPDFPRPPEGWPRPPGRLLRVDGTAQGPCEASHVSTPRFARRSASAFRARGTCSKRMRSNPAASWRTRRWSGWRCGVLTL
jgi:hypothetical protein